MKRHVTAYNAMKQQQQQPQQHPHSFSFLQSHHFGREEKGIILAEQLAANRKPVVKCTKILSETSNENKKKQKQRIHDDGNRDDDNDDDDDDDDKEYKNK